INRLAIFTLPQEMIGFYKHHIRYIKENAVNPDRRRYAVEGEAPKHYIDLDVYSDSAAYKLPRYWHDAVEAYSEDTLKKYGTVPWHINFMALQLTDAMRINDAAAILKLSADLGHYVADAHVPLHTTENYNGQLTGQHGIHGFWESRLPELYAREYDFFVGRAEYIENVQLATWEAVIQAHQAVDSVLHFEKQLDQQVAEDKQYAFETRGQQTIRAYAREYAQAYHKKLGGMVERQMRASVKMTGDIWYTCWVNAGQPNLEALIDFSWSEEELKKRKEALDQWKEKRFKTREHESNDL
ncbi:MAG: zinc dependent phospholipase C family protein, partial [Fulvivirga sp.]|nr:zinc dependent phospholipase C family protein [Fulvivirga sp.]